MIFRVMLLVSVLSGCAAVPEQSPAPQEAGFKCQADEAVTGSYIGRKHCKQPTSGQ